MNFCRTIDERTLDIVSAHDARPRAGAYALADDGGRRARKPPFKEGITDLDTGTVLYDASVAELANGRELTIPLAAPARRHLSEAS
ncbi:hypothetical protein [Collinsella sp. D33t1_170424_A12]|uniref:hypothetical protein n=1 Tax=Collinsella sp. D33t1_170424_A12 TaxID=2787135 RepID=UPI0018997B60|nr:hypothetical protein [Collinsella sp. D33t1_170424_A12]